MTYFPVTTQNAGGSTLASTTETVSYTAALTDAGTVVEMNSASPINFTIPPHSSVAFPIGATMEVCQFGSGQVTVLAGAGVTLHTSTGTSTTRAQYSSVFLRQRATDEWMIAGDLS